MGSTLCTWLDWKLPATRAPLPDLQATGHTPHHRLVVGLHTVARQASLLDCISPYHFPVARGGEAEYIPPPGGCAWAGERAP